MGEAKIAKQQLLDSYRRKHLDYQEEVTVQCRKQDAKLVKQVLGDALGKAKAKAEKETGQAFNMRAVFDKETVKCSGGVVVKARRGRVVCDNTLDARLRIILHKELPFIRENLFDQDSLSLKQ